MDVTYYSPLLLPNQWLYSNFHEFSSLFIFLFNLPANSSISLHNSGLFHARQAVSNITTCLQNYSVISLISQLIDDLLLGEPEIQYSTPIFSAQQKSVKQLHAFLLVCCLPFLHSRSNSPIPTILLALFKGHT